METTATRVLIVRAVIVLPISAKLYYLDWRVDGRPDAKNFHFYVPTLLSGLDYSCGLRMGYGRFSNTVPNKLLAGARDIEGIRSRSILYTSRDHQWDVVNSAVSASNCCTKDPIRRSNGQLDFPFCPLQGLFSVSSTPRDPTTQEDFVGRSRTLQIQLLPSSSGAFSFTLAAPPVVDEFKVHHHPPANHRSNGSASTFEMRFPTECPPRRRGVDTNGTLKPQITHIRPWF